jgi:hypothetical protein
MPSSCASSEYSGLLLDINIWPEENRVMWKRIGMFITVTGAAWAQGMEGSWQGTLDTGAMKLRIGLHVSSA